MTELEKFKRRLIRMVARLHVQQKKPEDELWEYLRKQTKCDCRWLWERMRALTLKRLKRLLIAEDRQENIPAVARMSLTDWLLFDCILVHEKIDVIGLELLGEDRRTEPRPLFELFSLVQKFELEGLRGEELARAWTAATISYNSGGRQCSPMLLQRRWYQLKDVTRTKFYNFWFSYRGNARLLTEALKDKPTRLQSAVAKRYPHIITMPFQEWEELIEKRFVIMPPEFEVQMKSRSGQLPKPIDDSDADLVLLEPEIETIDLRVDSESDEELRDEVEGSKATQLIANEDISAVQSITLKQEPIDEDHIEEGIDLDSAHMEAIDAELDHIEGIEALEKMDIPIEVDETEKSKPPPVQKKRGRRKKLLEAIEIKDNDIIDDSDSMEYTEEDSRYSIEEKNESLMTENITSVHSLHDETGSSALDVSSASKHIDIKPEIDVSLAIKDVSSVSNEHATTSTVNSLDDRISPIAVKGELADVSETDHFEGNMDESPEMPQITNVFGNVNIPDDALQKLSSYLDENKAPTVKDQDIEDEIEEDIIKTEVKAFCAANIDSSGDMQAPSLDADSESKIKTSIENFKNDLLGETLPDMTFEDDGIEFIDDGIVEEAEHAMKNDGHGITAVKQEISRDNMRAPEESQSIDLKLLMVPVVYTRKLEHMDILRDEAIFHVKGEDRIELIVNESRPVGKKSIEIKEEQQAPDKTMTDDEYDAHDDLFDKPDDASIADSSDDEDAIPEEKKVAVSSVLFKKPRNRDYGPLVICKNPDFNTRLKRLTAGFLSYARNRFLLAACKPLTIDLCKAFESKLVDNTVYLKETYVNKFAVKEEKSEEPEENSHTPPIVQENLAQATVEQTTDSVHNLVNSILEKALPPAKEATDVRKQIEERIDAIVERNKVIVLPNIDNVRRINQKLLVAEVSPMRVENTNHVPPVSLVSGPMDKLNLPVSEESPDVETLAPAKPVHRPEKKEMPSGTVICSGQVINNVTCSVRNYRGNAKYWKPPWRPEVPRRVARGFWSSKKPKHQAKRSDEQLLTVDTLNKMLNIVHHKDPVSTYESVNYKANQRDKQRQELQKKVNEIQKMLTGENSRSSTEDMQDAEKQADTNKQASDETRRKFDCVSSKLKRGRPKLRGGRSRKVPKMDYSGGYGTYCCWIQFKLNHPRSMNVHPCAHPCVCCCREGVELEIDPSIKKVCESIESVVEQSRVIVEKEINENHTTPTISVPLESNIIDITDENDSKDKFDSTKKHDTERNYDIVNSNDIGLANSEKSKSSKNVQINTDGINKSETNSFGPGYVAANITIACVKDQAVTREDCVVIDSDESEMLEKGKSRPPAVKVNVSYVEEPPKRKRGRPAKLNEPIQKPPRVRTSQRKFNICPIVKDTEPDKNVLVLNSNHIRKTNHPIFLGKNKILLTDVPLPRNKDKPAPAEESPALINTQLPLPQGVNLMLLPNGVLTCTVDPNVQMSTEEITNLGVIIDSIQKQISSAVSGVDPTAQVGSVLQAPAMEMTTPTITVPGVTQNEDVVNLDDNDAQKSTDDNIQVVTTTTDSVEATTNITTAAESVAPIDNVISNDGDSAVNDEKSSLPDVMESTPMKTDGTVQSPSEQIVASEQPVVPEQLVVSEQPVISEQPVVSEQLVVSEKPVVSEQPPIAEPTDSVPPSSTTTKNNIKESDELKENTAKETNVDAVQDAKGTEPETEPVNKKTILSDLMEMSGIFEEDIAPVEPAHQTPEVPQYPIASESPVVLAPPPLLVRAVNPTSVLPELTPITSFTEMKYACSQNGNFFKLDLETKSLTPINVCIKKKVKVNIEPKQFVDLTDDVDVEESISNETHLVIKKPRTYFVRKTKVQDTSSSSVRKPEPAKPLKLFKVVHPFGTNVNILQKSKRAPNSKDDLLSNLPGRPKRARKQNLTEHTYEMQTLSFLTNEEEKEDYEFDGSFEDTVMPVEDSDSSDDEPLAKKVRRKQEALNDARLAEKAASDENKETVVEPPEVPVPDELPAQNEDNELPIPVGNLDLPPTELGGVVDESEWPIEELDEGALGPSEVEFLSDDNEEEDCILGV